MCIGRGRRYAGRARTTTHLRLPGRPSQTAKDNRFRTAGAAPHRSTRELEHKPAIRPHRPAVGNDTPAESAGGAGPPPHNTASRVATRIGAPAGASEPDGSGPPPLKERRWDGSTRERARPIIRIPAPLPRLRRHRSRRGRRAFASERDPGDRDEDTRMREIQRPKATICASA